MERLAQWKLKKAQEKSKNANESEKVSSKFVPNQQTAISSDESSLKPKSIFEQSLKKSDSSSQKLNPLACKLLFLFFFIIKLI